MTRPDAPHHVYRCYDAEDTLLYIGCTQNVQTRLAWLTSMCNLSRHPAVRTLIERMTRHTVETFPTRAAAFAAERRAIATEAPLLNINSQAGGRRTA